MRLEAVPAVLFLVAGVPCAAQTHEVHPNNLAPYVASPPPVIEKMLEIAAVKPGEMVYDLGCGDGRILITAVQKFGAKAVGVELSKRHFDTAVENIRRLGLTNHAKVIHGNLMDLDLTGADVVTLYLLTLSNDRLRPKLEQQLKPGARVVSLEYKIRGWKPVKVEKAEAHHRNFTIYLYEVPKPN